MLPRALAALPPTRACFWLDGHYSGPGTARGSVVTPILRELEIIAPRYKAANDLILIDDARLFDVNDDYPSKHQLFEHIEQLFGVRPITSRSDAIAILPR